jgi:hypothetical protein
MKKIDNFYILLPLIIIGFLIIGYFALYFGMKGGTRFLPDRCSFGPEIQCIDYSIINSGDRTVIFQLKNNFGEEVILNDINVNLNSQKSQGCNIQQIKKEDEVQKFHSISWEKDSILEISSYCLNFNDRFNKYEKALFNIQIELENKNLIEGKLFSKINNSQYEKYHMYKQILKYVYVFLFFSIFIFLIHNKENKKIIRNKKLLGIILFTLIILGYIIFYSSIFGAKFLK